MSKKKIIELFENKDTSILPIWIMRQAGRYLPEYREIRSNTKSFLDLCYNSDLASEVTMQPIRRFGFDAAIIFSDILVIPDALGANVTFVEGEGPRIEQINSSEKLAKLNFDNFVNHLEPVYRAIKLTREQLPSDKALIGFVGAPWTIATYMLQGKASKDFAEAKIYAYQNFDMVMNLINILTDAVIIHLENQIRHGADIVQIFDSWAGVLDKYMFDKLVINPTKKIVAAIRSKYPNIPIICFPKGAGYFYSNFIDNVVPNAIGLDSVTPIGEISKNNDIILQGNLDPTILFAPKDIIKSRVLDILDSAKDLPLIFNLGHGILPKTPIENVYYLIELVRNYKK